MGVAYAEETFSGVVLNRVRIVGDRADLFGEGWVGDALVHLWVQLGELAGEECFERFTFRGEVFGGHRHAHADRFGVQGNEPGPMVFGSIKDERVVMDVAETPADLREDSHLFVVVAPLFGTDGARSTQH